ncbi:DUF6471 domain-containing protein [Paraburkholderia sp. GAS348]|uniref:DUF6471 domain-containing protein n=1 Tax=Paraburkholderia sp. GAS348 TaxID=3035132 RepID=UPI003D1D4085
MSDKNDITWTKLATRVMRAVLARKDENYAALAAELRKLGADETARSVEGKVQRGSFRFAFFLQSLSVVGAEYPLQWRADIDTPGTWEQRASRVMQVEMGIRAGMTFVELSRRLCSIGVTIPAHTLSEQVTTGTYPLTLLLQCAAVLWITDVERFIDRSDLYAAAAATSTASR